MPSLQIHHFRLWPVIVQCRLWYPQSRSRYNRHFLSLFLARMKKTRDQALTITSRPLVLDLGEAPLWKTRHNPLSLPRLQKRQQLHDPHHIDEQYLIRPLCNPLVNIQDQLASRHFQHPNKPFPRAQNDAGQRDTLNTSNLTRKIIHLRLMLLLDRAIKVTIHPPPQQIQKPRSMKV